MSSHDRILRVGMVGYAFMGAAHSQAWRTVNRVFDLPARVRMSLVCGRDEPKVADAADRLGWDGYTTDWRRLVESDEIDVVDICTPGDSHGEIALAALAAGKHVLCEKPLANTVAEAREMTAAAARARESGVRAMCGFNYRRVPAVALMRQFVADGRLGEIRHVRATYLQDWIVDPQFPLVWRLQQERAGSGALGDIGAHIIDLTQYVTGQQITGVSALTETFVKQRPLPSESSGLAAQSGGNGQGTGPVTVDDAAVFVARLDGGGLATYEATRFATGRKNALRVEINGSRGSVAFDLERLNELEFLDATRPAAEQGFSRILVTEPEHPYLAAWWPPGHIIGYEHSFTHQMRDFVEAVATGVDPTPSFADALQVQQVLDAVSRSAAASAWAEVEKEGAPLNASGIGRGPA
ncbi:Gfo/Idh/MocA family oxidoreductase [Micromonospora sp. WMMD975]|uniref:Gfo/Idh/MocA family protein n=1 Tax=Micromonospora sp. WMMD975 TaxID=3016087 RepID=UPI00249C8A91|nr:Gfo/Idh/MocA family oxidoreductase [Micromonospora sp. WMMD975]WFE31581.1 Gfo/Idh/MocA family oxidoreductase [Micromonospora sp. WMMD975]